MMKLALQNMLDEVEESNRKIKEEWLQKYHSEWKENLELNEKISKDIETLKNRISIKLEPEANTKKIKVEQLKNNLQASFEVHVGNETEGNFNFRRTN